MGGLALPTLYEGKLVRRYKRFLADIDTPDGIITAHCPNTGAMTGCADPGSQVWFSITDNPKRKYRATWEFVDTSNGYCSVNTGRANQLVGWSLRNKVLQAFADYDSVQPEVRIPDTTGRFDFKLTRDDLPDAYVEVKSVTLHLESGLGAFPDAVSARAKRHLEALTTRVQAGDRGILIFCAQHCGIHRVQAAADIDPDYAQALLHAHQNGVEVYAYGCATDLVTMSLRDVLDVAISG